MNGEARRIRDARRDHTLPAVVAMRGMDAQTRRLRDWYVAHADTTRRVAGVVAQCCPDANGRWQPLAAVHIVPGVGPVIFGVRRLALASPESPDDALPRILEPLDNPVVVENDEPVVVRCLACDTEYNVPLDELAEALDEHRRTGRRKNLVVGP